MDPLKPTSIRLHVIICVYIGPKDGRIFGDLVRVEVLGF